MCAKRVKCKYCNKYIYRENSYADTSYDDSKTYYCNEEHYNMFVEERKIKYSINESCGLIFGFNITKFPLYKKKINEIQQDGELKIADRYIKENILELSVLLETKCFSILNNKIVYFFEIVRNGINEFNELIKIAEKDEGLKKDIEIVEDIKFVPRKKRKSIAEILDSYV